MGRGRYLGLRGAAAVWVVAPMDDCALGVELFHLGVRVDRRVAGER